MWYVSEVGVDWHADGNVISKHKNFNTAEARVYREIRKKVKHTKYVRVIELSEKCRIYDYGLWGLFMKLEEIDND